jgi:hypothetical protein
MLLQVQQKRTLLPKLVPVDIGDTSFASSGAEKVLNSSNVTSTEQILEDEESPVPTKQLLLTTSKSIPTHKTAHIHKTTNQSTAGVSTSSIKTPPPSSTVNVIKVKQPPSGGLDNKRKLVDDHAATNNNSKKNQKKNPSDEIDDIFRGLF